MIPSPPPPGVDPEPGRVPVHVAWVAGGSGRWAARHQMSARALAAAEGRVLVELARGALELGVRWLTIQAPGGAAGFEQFRRFAPRLGAGVVVRSLGTGAEPSDAAKGGGEPALTVTLAAGYSGRREIVDAVRRLADDGVDPADVDEGSIARRLYAPGMPDPDLLVRTGGDRRIPDLLLWEEAYSELVFIDDPWPEIGRQHFAAAVADYQRRERRYGGVVAPPEAVAGR